MSPEVLPELAFDERGLVPVVVQEASTGQVLMLAWADIEALQATLETRFAHYHSRSREALWRKGDTSGNVQRLVDVRYDCDADAVLYLVDQTGPACHTGEQTCFHNSVLGAEDRDATDITAAMRTLESVVRERLASLPEGSYVSRLHGRGVGYVAQKVVEEAGETIVAALQSRPDELRGEAADLLFHLTVLLAETGVAWDDVGATLLSRHRPTAVEPDRS
ncbi:MAG TPA: bifunctional phosphoribosyl-AMP cyclohydrolase/phosphoribosyl-ATP diphosphatase HisIE [Trueperaceae bacterium]|nr:bifunctional phosphoribosyl-AMP cyclohydrolase/phosphoribosyl-ATP diphosphatase HisIE [Trueperaceae bacterium]